MDALVAAAQQLSATVEASSSYQDLHEAIKDSLADFKKSDVIRQQAQQHPAQTLQGLDPSKHSVLSAVVLAYALQPSFFKKLSEDERGQVRDATVAYLLNFDPIQGRYVGKQLETILSTVGTLFPPRTATQLMATAILRLDPKGSIFTLAHLELAKLACQEGCSEPALPVLSRNITSFPMSGPSKSGVVLCDPNIPTSVCLAHIGSVDVRPDSVIEYNFVCGLVHTSRRDWADAHAAFQRAITHPAKEKGVSKITVEAYKRWLLIGLLRQGQEPTLPNYTSSLVKDACRSLAQPYIAFSKHFAASSASQLKTCAEANTAVWTEDGTLSLVVEVVAAYQKWQIMNLRQVYTQISVSQLDTDTASAQTGESLKDPTAMAALVQSMIDGDMLKGHLHADENGTTYLTFQDDQALLTEQDFSREIARSHHAIQTLGADYKTVNDRLSGHKDYVKHVAREQKRLEKEAENPSGGFEAQIEDEDLMTGIMVSG